MPSVEDLLSAARVVSVLMAVRFRGVQHREALLLEGPPGGGEFSPFMEYDDVEAARWLAAAVEAAWTGWPTPVRDAVPVNATVPAVGAAQVAGVLARFDGCTTAKVKVAEAGQSLADDVARVREVRAGRLMFDDRFIPPTLDAEASARLRGGLNDLVGRAEQRAEELALRAVEATDGGAERSEQDVIAPSRRVATRPRPRAQWRTEGIDNAWRPRCMGDHPHHSARDAQITGEQLREVPVARIDGRPIGEGVPGPVARRLQAAVGSRIPT